MGLQSTRTLKLSRSAILIRRCLIGICSCNSLDSYDLIDDCFIELKSRPVEDLYMLIDTSRVSIPCRVNRNHCSGRI